MSSSSATASRVRTMRTMCLAFMGSVIVIGVAVAFMFEFDDLLTAPDLLGLVGPLVVAALAIGAILTVGMNVPAVPASTDALASTLAGIGSYQSTLFVRLAFATLPAYVAIALMFIASHPSLVTYAIGAVAAIVLIAVFAFPNRFNARLIERRLDRAGGRSGLSRALGFESRPEAPAGYHGNATFH